MRRLLAVIGTLAWLLVLPTVALAQAGTPAQALTSCGAPNNTPVNGSYYSITAGLSGGMCTVDIGLSYSEITTGTTTLVKSGASTLHSVCINTPVISATVKIYNALTATGTPFTLTLPSTITGQSPFCMPYNVYFNTGITVVTSGATDVTVTFGS